MSSHDKRHKKKSTNYKKRAVITNAGTVAGTAAGTSAGTSVGTTSAGASTGTSAGTSAGITSAGTTLAGTTSVGTTTTRKPCKYGKACKALIPPAFVFDGSAIANTSSGRFTFGGSAAFASAIKAEEISVCGSVSATTNGSATTAGTVSATPSVNSAANVSATKTISSANAGTVNAVPVTNATKTVINSATTTANNATKKTVNSAADTKRESETARIIFESLFGGPVATAAGPPSSGTRSSTAARRATRAAIAESIQNAIKSPSIGGSMLICKRPDGPVAPTAAKTTVPGPAAKTTVATAAKTTLAAAKTTTATAAKTTTATAAKITTATAAKTTIGGASKTPVAAAKATTSSVTGSSTKAAAAAPAAGNATAGTTSNKKTISTEGFTIDMEELEALLASMSASASTSAASTTSVASSTSAASTATASTPFEFIDFKNAFSNIEEDFRKLCPAAFEAGDRISARLLSPTEAAALIITKATRRAAIREMVTVNGSGTAAAKSAAIASIKRIVIPEHGFGTTAAVGPGSKIDINYYKSIFEQLTDIPLVREYFFVIDILRLRPADEGLQLTVQQRDKLNHFLEINLTYLLFHWSGDATLKIQHTIVDRENIVVSPFTKNCTVEYLTKAKKKIVQLLVQHIIGRVDGRKIENFPFKPVQEQEQSQEPKPIPTPTQTPTPEDPIKLISMGLEDDKIYENPNFIHPSSVILNDGGREKLSVAAAETAKQNLIIVAELQQLFERFNYFTVLDFNYGHGNVPIAESDQIYTTFDTPFGCYRFRRMYTGLTNANETFMRLYDVMRSACPVTLNSYPFLGKILISSMDFEQHFTDLNVFGQVCIDLQVRAVRDSSTFCCDSISFMDRKIIRKGKPVTIDHSRNGHGGGGGGAVVDGELMIE